MKEKQNPGECLGSLFTAGGLPLILYNQETKKWEPNLKVFDLLPETPEVTEELDFALRFSKMGGFILSNNN